ncbi:unnamed protein product [Menidia menidia]|uniref:(Atlantic silverside) hypothetical protein n=1 Tax=Menidia menidia TaxID=238744 RepID=A0A8S4BY58_9TELE|nr:unnamed protein product [Menidia menidia]
MSPTWQPRRSLIEENIGHSSRLLGIIDGWRWICSNLLPEATVHFAANINLEERKVSVLFRNTSGVVFDTRSKMVMSQGGTAERMKEKISAVRAVVPNKSNNEIVLVLQHFENSVDKAVQAFLEGSAVEILKEWNVTGKKKPKKKKKPKPQPEASAEPAPPEATMPEEDKDEMNGFHANGSTMDGESLDSLSEQLDSASLDAAELDSEPATSETTGAEAESQGSAPSPASQKGGRNHQGPRGNKSRHRPGSNSHPHISSLASTTNEQGSSGAKKMAPNIDRSVKDLQRCTASLTRYRMVVKEEMDSSIKRMKQTFAELQSWLAEASAEQLMCQRVTKSQHLRSVEQSLTVNYTKPVQALRNGKCAVHASTIPLPRPSLSKSQQQM